MPQKEAWSMLKFTVQGEPIPQGSMRAFMPEKSKFPVVTSDNPRLKKWRKLVAQCSGLAMRKADFIQIARQTPVRLTLDFYFDKPKSEKGIDKVTRPDLDKCVRAIQDAMTTAGVYEDDAQVTELCARKLFGSPARVEIQVEEADFPPGTTVSRPILDCELPF